MDHLEAEPPQELHSHMDQPADYTLFSPRLETAEAASSPHLLSGQRKLTLMVMLQAWTRPLLYPEEVLLPTWSLQRAECEPLRPRPWDAQDWQLCWRSRDEIYLAQSTAILSRDAALAAPATERPRRAQKWWTGGPWLPIAEGVGVGALAHPGKGGSDGGQGEAAEGEGEGLPPAAIHSHRGSSLDSSRVGGREWFGGTESVLEVAAAMAPR